MNLKETFKKQGGIKLLKQYWQGGALFTGIGQFLLLGKSRTALEILRLSTTLKTKQKLEKKYNWKLEEFDKTYTEKIPYYRRSNFVSTQKFVERYGELADWPESNITNRGKHMAKLAYDTIWKF